MCQNLSAMPFSKGADKTDDGFILQIILTADTRSVNLSGIDFRVHTIGIHQNLIGIDSSIYEIVFQWLAYDNHHIRRV